MTLQELWASLADITASSEMKCGKAERCRAACCRPALGGGEPGVTAAEIAAIDNFLAKRRGFRFYEAGQDSCKFLDSNGKCRIYPVRPIDCRVHFCAGDSAASQANGDISALVDDYHARHEAEFMATELIDSVRFRGEG